MPVKVHCPNGCVFRVPQNRVGKAIRCPECKQSIRISAAPENEPDFDAIADLVTADPAGTAITAMASSAENDTEGDDERPRLNVPIQIEPPSVRRRRSVPSETSSAKSESRQRTDKPMPTVDLASRVNGDDSGFELPSTEQISMQQRVRTATKDRVVLSRFFALCLCLVAIVNLVPAIYCWIQWSREVGSAPLPRWIYLQCFVAALHVIYAVYLAQIEDWSALKAVSFAMLSIAFLFGVISTGLLIGGGQGAIPTFLELPHAMTSQASIWCVAMLCLSTLMCYIGGKVAVNWQRTEQLLKEIVS